MHVGTEAEVRLSRYKYTQVYLEKQDSSSLGSGVDTCTGLAFGWNLGPGEAVVLSLILACLGDAPLAFVSDSWRCLAPDLFPQFLPPYGFITEHHL